MSDGALERNDVLDIIWLLGQIRNALWEITGRPEEDGGEEEADG